MSADPEHIEVQASPASGAESTVRHLHPVETTSTPEPIEGELVEGEEVEPGHDENDEGQGEDNEDDGRLRGACGWVVSTFTPASGLYTDRQPSIEETLRRARDGAQLPESGPLRAASRAYGYGAAAATAALETGKWVVAHPARLAVIATLMTLALLFPPTRHALAVSLSPLVWLHTALS